MKSILRLQVFSFVSRLVAMFSGIFQSLIIVNLLSVKQFGLIGLVTSIAGIAGITQHLGLASSSTKEISHAKSDAEVVDIVIASLSIRFLISFPIAFILIFFAPSAVCEPTMEGPRNMIISQLLAFAISLAKVLFPFPGGPQINNLLTKAVS